jgi:TPR repeat protein
MADSVSTRENLHGSALTRAVGSKWFKFCTHFEVENQESFRRLKHYRPYRFANWSFFLFEQANRRPYDARSSRIVMLIALLGLGCASLSTAIAQAPASSADALASYRKTAEQGNLEAQAKLGKYYQGQRDYAQAVLWLRKAADQGDVESQMILGLDCARGDGVTKDEAEAVRWFQKAAAQGSLPSQYILGTSYEEAGLGVKRDYAEAMRWFQKAAAQGDAKSQFSIGEMYELGWGIPASEKTAMDWYLKSANQGHAPAQAKIGLWYTKGKNIDYPKALEWLKRAADQSDFTAEGMLGALYDAGYGVKQDFVQAMKWYRLAADHGNQVAPYAIGVLYETGRGVPKDFVEAINWYQKGANQGDAEAKKRLDNLRNSNQQVVQGKSTIPGALQYRCFLQVDVDSLTKNRSKAETNRLHDECLRSNWERLYGSVPFPADQ